MNVRMYCAEILVLRYWLHSESSSPVQDHNHSDLTLIFLRPSEINKYFRVSARIFPAGFGSGADNRFLKVLRQRRPNKVWNTISGF